MSFHDDDLSAFRSVHSPVATPALDFLSKSRSSTGVYALFGKPLLDVFFILLAAPIILTLVGVGALLVMLDGGNPFYTQRRVGQNGRVFNMFKLRTMVPHADDLLARHLATNASARAEWAANQKLRNDPRITLIGRFLRKTSIDEMPQFLNVLMGQMAIVGPRPFTDTQEELYLGRRYYEVKPGLTGLWQISTRHDSEFAARVNFDDLYVRTLSLSGDFRIMLRTVGAVVRGTGC